MTTPSDPNLRPTEALFLEHRSVRTATLAGLFLLLWCGVVDWFSGPEIAFSVVYLIPISLVAWRGGRWMGLGMALLCGGTWLGVELASRVNYSHAFIPYWNGLVRLAIFCFVAMLVSEVARRKVVERELRRAGDELTARATRLAQSESALAQQRGILQSVLNNMAEGILAVDANGRPILSNPAALHMLHVTTTRPANCNDLPQDESLSGALVARLRELPDGGMILDRTAHGEQMDMVEICLPHPDEPTESWLQINSRPMLDEQRNISGGLFVLNDITARRKLERQIAEISDREQRRLGQDLHDGLCQQLVSLAFATRNLADRLRDDARPEAAEADQITDGLNDSITLARDVARGLYLVQLEIGGLSSAFEELADQIRARYHLDCQFVDRVTVPLHEPFAMPDLFRIAQEAVTNAVKHARAQHLTISLETDESRVVLQVIDDGIGLTAATTNPARRGMGLHIMQYRARMIGATCTVENSPAGGTVITCCLPQRYHPSNSSYEPR
jgi:signal transduction histidine kinase